MRTTLKPLKLPGFKPLAGSYSINEVGNWFGEVALTILVFDQTGSILATMSLFLAMEFAPSIIGPALTSRAEAAGSRIALPTIYLLQAGAFLTLALVADSFTLGAVLMLAAIDGTLGIAGRSLSRAASAEILKPRHLLREGNALLNLSYTIACAAGPLAAGLIVGGLGVQTALTINAISFLAAGLLLTLSSGVPNVKAEPEHWYAHLRDGIRFATQHQLLRRFLITMLLAYLFFAVAAPAEILLVKEDLGAGDAGYGLLLTAWGAGMVLGGVVFAVLRSVPIVTVWIIGVLVSGIGIAGLAFAPSLLVACTLAAVAGLGNGMDWPATATVAQIVSPKQFQARVASLVSSVATLAPGLGFVLGGAVGYLTSARFTFLVAGIGAIGAMAIAFPWLRKAGAAKTGSESP